MLIVGNGLKPVLTKEVDEQMRELHRIRIRIIKEISAQIQECRLLLALALPVSQQGIVHQACAIAVNAVVGVNIHMAQKRRRALVERVLRNGIRQVGVICTARYAKTDQLIIDKDAPEVIVLFASIAVLVLVLNKISVLVIDLVARLLVQIDHRIYVVGTQSPYFNLSHCPVLSLISLGRVEHTALSQKSVAQQRAQLRVTD